MKKYLIVTLILAGITLIGCGKEQTNQTNIKKNNNIVQQQNNKILEPESINNIEEEVNLEAKTGVEDNSIYETEDNSIYETEDNSIYETKDNSIYEVEEEYTEACDSNIEYYEMEEYYNNEQVQEEVENEQIDETIYIMGIDECRIKLADRLGLEEYELYFTGSIQDPETGELIETFLNTSYKDCSDYVYGIIADSRRINDMKFKRIFSDGSVVNFYEDGTSIEEYNKITQDELQNIMNNINSMY